MQKTTFLLFLSVLMILAACSSNAEDEAPAASSTPVYTIISEGSLAPGDSIPTPEDETAVILTVTGKVSNTNQEDSIVMDIATIESLGVVEYTVTDPFEETDVTYRGVLLNTLLDVWQVDEDATTLSVLALNDYLAEIPLASLQDYPVIFAMQQDGAYMPIATRGPAMLVFPYNDFEFDQSLYNDYWVWQIKSIEVK